MSSDLPLHTSGPPILLQATFRRMLIRSRITKCSGTKICSTTSATPHSRGRLYNHDKDSSNWRFFGVCASLGRDVNHSRRVSLHRGSVHSDGAESGDDRRSWRVETPRDWLMLRLRFGDEERRGLICGFGISRLGLLWIRCEVLESGNLLLSRGLQFFPPYYSAILSSPDRLARALDQVKNLGFVSESSSVSLNSELYTKLSQVLTKQVKEQWSIKVLRWLCFIFPLHELWEDSPSFTSIVRSLQPLLEHLVRSVGEASVPRSLKDEVSEALLAASKVSNIRSKTLSLVAGLLGDESPPHLHAEFALQRSILLRLDGDFKNSERVIHDFCCRCEIPGQSCLPTYFQQRQKQTAELSHRLNTLYGLIHRSHLENLVQCEQYELAKEQIDDWQLTRTASPMEWDILPSRTLTTSKIFRSQGAFKCAQQNLELCVKVLHHREPTRAQETT